MLKDGRAKGFRFSTLEAMCRVFKCQSGDMLEWVACTEVGSPATEKVPVGTGA